MPRSPNDETPQAFRSHRNHELKFWVIECHYCGWSRARNTTRQIAHLAQCRPYRQFLHDTGNSGGHYCSSTSINGSLNTNPSEQPLQVAMSRWLSNLSPISDNRILAPLTSEIKDILQLKATFAVYMGARSFMLLNDRYFRQ
ncbi:hypothetical protein B9Z19DRAFT_1069729 [Tuber borchii]|uniref:Uncharacterized protein n=1 Tax=Tuber borchii TaxID=42251 RepID=A0A2T6ZAG1_TUBBO|nr:hypothetical protein B9Z19DRAFT_1069729 [Tuber borchii]